MSMTMTLKERQRFLADVDIFARCKKRDLRAMAKSCEERLFPPGKALCRQGQRGLALFVITSGEVKVLEELEDGSVIEVARLGPGAAVGEMAIFDGEERTATVVAVTEVETLLLTAWDFKAMLRSRPEVALDILPVIVKRFRETTEELRRMRRGPATTS